MWHHLNSSKSLFSLNGGTLLNCYYQPVSIYHAKDVLQNEEHLKMHGKSCVTHASDRL